MSIREVTAFVYSYSLLRLPSSSGRGGSRRECLLRRSVAARPCSRTLTCPGHCLGAALALLVTAVLVAAWVAQVREPLGRASDLLTIETLGGTFTQGSPRSKPGLTRHHHEYWVTPGLLLAHSPGRLLMDLHLEVKLTGIPEGGDMSPALLKLLDAVAELSPTVVTGPSDPGWTAERALRYVENINDGARLLLRAAIDGDGRADATAFRARHGDSALRGPSTSLTNTLKSGARRGWWPADITPLFPPAELDKGGWSKAACYRLADELLPIFRDVLARYDAERTAQR